jgi:hypothetical protein
MNLLDLSRPAAAREAVHSAAETPVDITLEAPVDPVAQLGSEVAALLSDALERVNALATQAQHDRALLRQLRDDLERARRLAIAGQQLQRLASGRVPVALEALDLTSALREALRLRTPELQARGLEVRQVLAPATVSSDPALLFTLLQALLDWAFEHAARLVSLRVEHQPWPARALLVCRFPHRLPAAPWVDAQARVTPPALDSLSWRLLHQTATLLAVRPRRQGDAQITTLTLEFPDPLPSPPETAVAPAASADAHAASSHELDNDNWAPNSQPLAGHHVLVLASRRELRSRVRQALRPMGLMLDFVTTVDEASEFCRGGLPHILVHEAALGGLRLARLRTELLAEEPRLGWLQVTEDGLGVELREVQGRATLCIGAQGLEEGLSAALMAAMAQAH